MKVSIQIRTIENQWQEVPPILHAVKDWDEAVTLGYAISRQQGKKSVRLVQVPDNMRIEKPDINLITRISGCYIQSN